MMEVWKERQENEDQLRELKRDKPKIVKVTKWVDWEYPILNFFKKLFGRGKNYVDKD